jgi:aminoglycoside phosphotransferase (APT) family kinase protein
MTTESNVRDEDSFDVQRMDSWLRTEIADLPDSLPHITQFTRGASNLTYRLSYPGRELVLRRPPQGTKAASAHDMGREVHVITHVRDQFPFVPTVRAYCTEESIIGSSFYVMDYLDGTILRPDNAANFTPEICQKVGRVYVDRWADLHSIDIDRAGLSGWGKGPGYVERQIRGWSDRYRRARTDDVPDGETVMSWLEANRPADVTACVIHGDWRLDNMVMESASLEVGREPVVVGVLDWEMATIGDPLMDVGAALAYWIDATDAEVDPAFAMLKRQPSDLPGMPTRQDIMNRYEQRMGFTNVDWTFYEVYGLFRLAVILQQIWARYVAGQTSNPAFAPFGQAVRVLVDRAARTRP